jgi:hypothetical protein
LNGLYSGVQHFVLSRFQQDRVPVETKDSLSRLSFGISLKNNPVKAHGPVWGQYHPEILECNDAGD